MIGELIAIAIVVVMPAAIVLGMLAAIALGVAGLAIDPAERRLVRR
jgi:hypothetical protein